MWRHLLGCINRTQWSCRLLFQYIDSEAMCCCQYSTVKDDVTHQWEKLHIPRSGVERERGSNIWPALDPGSIHINLSGSSHCLQPVRAACTEEASWISNETFSQLLEGQLPSPTQKEPVLATSYWSSSEGLSPFSLSYPPPGWNSLKLKTLSLGGCQNRRARFHHCGFNSCCI